MYCQNFLSQLANHQLTSSHWDWLGFSPQTSQCFRFECLVSAGVASCNPYYYFSHQPEIRGDVSRLIVMSAWWSSVFSWVGPITFANNIFLVVSTPFCFRWFYSNSVLTGLLNSIISEKTDCQSDVTITGLQSFMKERRVLDVVTGP